MDAIKLGSLPQSRATYHVDSSSAGTVGNATMDSSLASGVLTTIGTENLIEIQLYMNLYQTRAVQKAMLRNGYIAMLLIQLKSKKNHHPHYLPCLQ